MATTLTNLETVRRVLRGVSGPQPLAGTALRAADAYAAMMAAEWTESGDGPAVPPHHCDNASPMPGDAYRQTWGYDKAKRTERSACGAVCYSVRLPDDALEGEDCGIASVSAKVFGDRYLECGTILTAILSDNEVPPAWDSVLADGASTSAILVPDTTDADDNEIEPNKRADTSATALLPIGDSAAAYLHLVLRVADYLAVRDAWHEGGAMLDPSTISVVFSRDVVPDDTSVPARWTAPEYESGDEAALSRTGNVFASATWPTGHAAGLSGDDLWDAVADIFSLAAPVADENVFNGHHMARLGRWPMASGTDPDGDYADVGAIRADYAGQSFPWLAGFVAGMRVRIPNRSRMFSRLSWTIPAAAMRVRVAVYLAGLPPVATAPLRHSTPSAALADWTGLFDGKAASLPFAEGAEMTLENVASAIVDLAAGSTAIPLRLCVDGSATVVVAVAPYAPRNYASVRWPLEGWILS